jgi:hypothetical protein
VSREGYEGEHAVTHTGSDVRVGRWAAVALVLVNSLGAVVAEVQTGDTDDGDGGFQGFEHN